MNRPASRPRSPRGWAKGLVMGRCRAQEVSVMLTSVPVQPGLKSSELVPIGEAAVRFGLRASALRYYEDRGLVTASARRGGKRWYDREQLRRIAFVQIGRQLGMTL